MRARISYLAMYQFLSERYKRLPSDALGQLLSELNPEFWDDGEPADSAIADDWDHALVLAEQDSSVAVGNTSVLRRAS